MFGAASVYSVGAMLRGWGGGVGYSQARPALCGGRDGTHEASRVPRRLLAMTVQVVRLSRLRQLPWLW